MVRLLVITAILCAGCEAQGVVDEPQPHPAAPPSTTYGEVQAPEGPLVPLSAITTDPSRYEGQSIRTQGQIERVCQKRGCWLELSDASGARAFVPMAGHAFVVPMDSVGHPALIEGTVHRRERSDAERAHLKSDGAGDRIPTVSIEANAVVIQAGSPG